MKDIDSVIIRKAERRDLDEIVTLWWELSIIDESFSTMPYLRDEQNCKKECLENYNRSFDWAQYCYIVSECNNRIIGYIIGSISKPPQKSKYHKRAIIENLIVKKEFYRTGIATLMYERIEQFAKDNLADYIEVSTECRNLPAISTYKSFGFQENMIELQKKL